jgi:quinol monooxygenase YgiN
MNTSKDQRTNLSYRIDTFTVPATARDEFEAAMRRNMAFIATLPGFREHIVFEKVAGPTSFDIVTIAIWENREAHEQAASRVRAYYQKIGFDLPAKIAQWGVKAELGDFRARGTRNELVAP